MNLVMITGLRLGSEAEELVTGAPVPLHAHYAQWGGGGRGIAVVQLERHPDGESDGRVCASGNLAGHDGSGLGCSVQTRTAAVFKIQQCDALALPSVVVQHDGLLF